MLTTFTSRLRGFLFLSAFVGCAHFSAREVPATSAQNNSMQPVTVVGANTDTVPVKPGSLGILKNSTDLLSSSQPVIKENFSAFFSHFKKVVFENDMKRIAPFVHFPFDEDGGPWTSEQFIKSFQLVADTRALIKNGKPKKINHSEYRLNGERTGLIFKKNIAGAWKWVAIHYAH